MSAYAIKTLSYKQLCKIYEKYVEDSFGNLNLFYFKRLVKVNEAKINFVSIYYSYVLKWKTAIEDVIDKCTNKQLDGVSRIIYSYVAFDFDEYWERHTSMLEKLGETLMQRMEENIFKFSTPLCDTVPEEGVLKL